MFTQNISVPHEFFKKSKNEYRDWVMAFFRELIQNSHDAKSTKIDFTFNSDNDEHYLIQCIDNGTGMSKDVLINSLLCLGGSHKDNENAIGGFGYAKTLLFFAHEGYTIKTNNHVISGCGGSYNYSESNEQVKGTHISILISKKDCDYSYRFEYALDEIMAFSNLPNLKITWNNEIKKSEKFKYEYNHPTPIGELKFKDSPDSYNSKLWVRINGLAMFEHYVYSGNTQSFIGIIELNKNPIEVLTSNRDSLKGESATEFNKIFKSLEEERSSLKNHKILQWVMNERAITNNQNQDSGVESEYETSNRVTHKESEKEDKAFENKFDKIQEPASFSPFNKLIEKNEKLSTSVNELFKKIDQDTYPINFSIQKNEVCSLKNHEIKSILNKQNSKKLAQKWKKVVYSILVSQENFDFYNERGEKETYKGQEGQFSYFDRRVNVGFTIGDFAIAVNSQNNEEILILINPVTNNNTTRLSNLFDSAFHEITHIWKENHDESFSSTEGHIKEKFREYWNPTEFKKLGKIVF